MATTLAQAKTALRRTIKAKLKALDAADIAAQSQIVIEKLRALEAFQRARSVSIFVSLPHEVETRGIIREMLRTGKRVFLPRYRSVIPIMVLFPYVAFVSMPRKALLPMLNTLLQSDTCFHVPCIPCHR